MDNRTLDREIAEKFFGWTQNEGGWWIDAGGSFQCFVAEFHPSTNHKSNTIVLDEIERRGWSYVLYYEPQDSEPYRFQFSRNNEGFHASAKYKEESICLAVLQAIKAEAEALRLLAEQE